MITEANTINSLLKDDTYRSKHYMQYFTIIVEANIQYAICNLMMGQSEEVKLSFGGLNSEMLALLKDKEVDLDANGYETRLEVEGEEEEKLGSLYFKMN